jgi:hypothetical protein
MLLLFTDGLLLTFITFSLGILSQKTLGRVFRCTIQSDPLGVFLCGLIFSAIYFNILSFWFPVNCLSLIPLTALSLFVLRRNKMAYRHVLFSMRRQLNAWRSHWVPFVCVLVLLFLYWNMPPDYSDGAGYHYLSILWYEKFKVVPGLANLQGRFGFNPASFIIQSAYSFTPLTGQAIYPLNGVITCLFFFWVLSRLFKHIYSLTGLVYFLFLIIFYRMFLGGMAAATPDVLVLACLSYALLISFEYILAGLVNIPKIIAPCLILLFAPIAKLSAYPALLIIPMFLYLLPKVENRLLFFTTMVLIGLIIYLPWLGRNYVLTGYLIYPSPQLDFFHPDWKVSRDILMIDYDQIVYGSRFDLTRAGEMQHLRAVAFGDWFFPWLYGYIKNNAPLIGLSILLSALFSPVLWMILYLRKKKPGIPLFLLWLIVYMGSWIWLGTSPDYRFGMAFLSLSFIFPLLLLTRDRELTNKRVPGILFSILFILSSLHYMSRAYGLHEVYTQKTHRSFAFTNWWLLPLKDVKYSMDNNKADFPYRIMQSGVKLYLSDSAHACLNTDFPCTVWDHIEIEMRGNSLEDGFRSSHSELWISHPYIR